MPKFHGIQEKSYLVEQLHYVGKRALVKHTDAQFPPSGVFCKIEDLFFLSTPGEFFYLCGKPLFWVELLHQKLISTTHYYLDFFLLHSKELRKEAEMKAKEEEKRKEKEKETVPVETWMTLWKFSFLIYIDDTFSLLAWNEYLYCYFEPNSMTKS